MENKLFCLIAKNTWLFRVAFLTDINLQQELGDCKLTLRHTEQFPFLVGLKNQGGHKSKVRASGAGYSEVVFTVE